MKRLARMFGSRAMTAWLITGFVLYYITVAVWGKEAFSSLMINLKENPFFIIAAAVLFMNISVRGTAALLGMRKNRMKMLLRFPLIAGLVFFLFAFFMSNVFRQFQWKMVGVDDMLEFEKAKVFRVSHIDPAMEGDVIRMEGDEGIFSYEPYLALIDSDGRQYNVGAYPPARVKGLYMHVLQFGIGPGIEFVERKTVIARGYMAMRLLPFGAMDSFEIPPFPYKFSMTIRPDQTVRKGHQIAYHYDIERPRYNVVITKGDKLVAEKETDSGITFDDHMKLSFFRPTYWIMIETVRDPFLPLFIGGMGLLAVGLGLYPFSLLVRERRDTLSVVDPEHL